MRALTLFSLVLLTAGCWMPAPGQRDPTRYPWDPRNRVAAAPAPHARVDARAVAAIARDPSWGATPPQGSFENNVCIIAIEQERRSGINTSANSGVLACTPAKNSAPKTPPPK